MLITEEGREECSRRRKEKLFKKKLQLLNGEKRKKGKTQAYPKEGGRGNFVMSSSCPDLSTYRGRRKKNKRPQ